MLLIRVLLLTGFGKKKFKPLRVVSYAFNLLKALYSWPKQQESIDLENSVSRSEMVTGG